MINKLCKLKQERVKLSLTLDQWTVKLSLTLDQWTVKLSLTLDQWTSLANRRFMNVNMHSPMLINEFVNLGLVRGIGSMPARTSLQLLENRLSAFELSLKDDIVCLNFD